jgi:hypothetical protein
METLAAVAADGGRPFHEVLVENVGRLRRGMTAIIITASLDPHWVRPLHGLRERGVEAFVILLDAPAFAAYTEHDQRAMSQQALNVQRTVREESLRAQRAVRHALAEHDLRWLNVEPSEPLAAQLVTRGPRPTLVSAQ